MASLKWFSLDGPNRILSFSGNWDIRGDINFTGNLYRDGALFTGSSQWVTDISSNISYDGNVGIGTSASATNILTLDGDANIVSGNYKIGDTTVLSATTLGTGVVNSSLTSLGYLNGLNVNGQVGIGTSTNLSSRPLTVFTGNSADTLNIVTQPVGSVCISNGLASYPSPTIVGRSNERQGLVFIGVHNDTPMTFPGIKFDVRSDGLNTAFTNLTAPAFVFSRSDTNSLVRILRNGNVEISGSLQVNGSIVNTQIRQKVSATVNTGWYRIAQCISDLNISNTVNQARSSAFFTVQDTRSSNHGCVRFSVNQSYGRAATVFIESGADFSNSSDFGAIRKIRTIRGGTYAGHVVDIYVEGSAVTVEAIMTQNEWTEGYTIKTWEPATVPTGFTAYEIPIDNGVVHGLFIDSNPTFTCLTTSNVGIGTASPTEKLVVNGNLGIGTAVMAQPVGTAPLYSARAWVNFDGTVATPSTIRGSGNVSSVTRNNTGDYTINFATNILDVNYGVIATAGVGTTTSSNCTVSLGTLATSSVRIFATVANTGTLTNFSQASVVIVR